MQVLSFSLPGLGALIEIQNETKKEDCQRKQPAIVVVMDMSGSMGDLAGIVLADCLPNAMQRAGYDLKTTNVKIIAFASNTSELLMDGKSPTGEQLQNSFYKGYGGTNMSGVFQLLAREIAKNENVTLFCISDGEIMDTEETRRVAQTYAQRECQAHVEVALVRLITSHVSNPDTRALACLGQFGTNGAHSIYDVKANSTLNEAPWRQELTQLLFHHLHSSTLVSVTSNSGLRRTPSDVPSQMLHLGQLDDGRFPMFLSSRQVTQICIDGQNYDVCEVKELSPRGLEFFCDYASTKVQLNNILGFDVDTMKVWFTKLSETMTNVVDVSPNMNMRIERMKRKLAAGLREAINDVLQNVNQARLNTLNQTQQQAADYLRQSASKALAKRNMKHALQQQNRGDITTMQQEFMTVLAKFKSMANVMEQESECSFFSVCNNYETLASIIAQEAELDVAMMGDFDILRIAGLLGVCYHHKPADFVDPYLFFVQDIFGGTFLNMCDLREANSQKLGGDTAELQAPGTNATVTGVVPLRYLNPPVFDLFWQNGMKLLEAHSSINMRRMLAPVRADMLGERMGVLNCILRKRQQQPLATWEQKVVDDMIVQLKMLLGMSPHKQEFEVLHSHIAQKVNFRNLLTGSNAISCMQKPMIALLCHASPNDKDYLMTMLEVLFELDAYHRARHHFRDENDDNGDRQKSLKQLLNIDVQKMLEWLPLTVMEYIPQEQDGVYRNDLISARVKKWMIENRNVWQINEEKLFVQNEMSWMPSRALYADYFSILTHNQATHNISSRRYFFALICAIYAKTEQDRIFDGKNQMFEWGNATSETEFLNRVAMTFYCQFYESELTHEMMRRDHAQLMTQIYLMVQPTVDLEEFRATLALEIPNREHPGYELLLSELLKQKKTRFWTQKLAVLISGRTLENCVCFAQGNFDCNFWKYQCHFDANEWKTLVDLHQEFGRWTYRDSDIPNRHGYCNSSPSDWAVNIYPQLQQKKK